MCKLRDRSRPGATIKVGQAIDAIAATFPGEALGGRDATAHGTEHDSPAAQAGEEPARDRAGVGTESGHGGPSAGRAGRPTAATTTSGEADRSVPRADRGLGEGGPDGGADVRVGPRRSRAAVCWTALGLPRRGASGAAGAGAEPGDRRGAGSVRGPGW